MITIGAPASNHGTAVDLLRILPRTRGISRLTECVSRQLRQVKELRNGVHIDALLNDESKTRRIPSPVLSTSNMVLVPRLGDSGPFVRKRGVAE